jgi:uncharacterized membrane-anchored protein YhcB (DUF1043 family)
MSDETQKLYIEVKVNADTGALDIVNGSLVKLDKAASGSAKGGLRQLGSALGVNVGAFAGAAGVAVAFAKVIKDSVENEEKEVQRQRQLKTTLDSLKLGYDKNKTGIDNNLKSLTAHTKFMRGEAYDVYNKAVLSQNSIAGGYKLVKIAMDEASRTGKPLSEVMDTLTGALAGGARGTKVLKEEFGALVGKGKNAAEMIENAGKAISGTAKHEDDLATQTKGLQESYTQITTVIGKALMPVISGLATVLKVVLVPVIAAVSAALAVVKNSVTLITGQITVLIAFMQGGWRAAAAAQKDMSDRLKKDWTENIDFVKDSTNTLFGTMKTGSEDAGKAVLKNVQEPLEKVKKSTKETKNEMEKSFDEIAKSLQSTLGAQFDKVFQGIVDSGHFTSKDLKSSFTDIYRAFRDMLIKMVAELIAREAIIGLLTLLSGGGVGFAASMLKGLTALPATGAIAGVGDTGYSSVPRTGLYKLKQGETVGTGPGPASGGGGNVTVHLGVSAFDLRSVSNNDLRRLARQLAPHISKEQNLK